MTRAPAEASGATEQKPPARPSRVPPWLFTALKVALSALAIGYVAWTVDLAAAWQRMANQHLWLIAAAAVALSAQIVMGALRWHGVLIGLGARTPAPDALRTFYVAAFFSSWLWGAVAGDAMRAWLSVRMRLSAITAINSILLDRAVAVAGVALLVILTAPLFAAWIGEAASGLIPAAVALAFLMGVGVAAQLHRLPLDWQRNRLLSALQTLSVATRAIFLQPRTALAILGFAVAAQLSLSLAAYALAASMSIGLTLLDCVVLIQPVVLVTALPISVGGWGVRETAMIALLGLVDVPASAALALSVQLGLLSMLAALPGAALWLRLKASLDTR